MASEMKQRIAEIVNEHRHVQEPIAVARMILQAMREPSDMMVLSGSQRDPDAGCVLIWQDMIDAALSEGLPKSDK